MTGTRLCPARSEPATVFGADCANSGCRADNNMGGAAVAVLVLSACLAVGAWSSGAAMPGPEVLRVEHVSQADGVDEAPWFSWRLPTAVPRGTLQQAYHLVVVRHPNNPIRSWDSGTVVSDVSGAHYSGPPLLPSTVYYWRVQFLPGGPAHGAQNMSAFSAWSSFSTGPYNWNAEWVGVPSHVSGNNTRPAQLRSEFSLELSHGVRSQHERAMPDAHRVCDAAWRKRLYILSGWATTNWCRCFAPMVVVDAQL